MEPPPPPDQTSPKADATGYRPWVSLCIWAVMFAGAQLCAKVKLLETAVSLKWSPEQVATVAKALGLK